VYFAHKSTFQLRRYCRRKLLQVVVAGLAAISFSALAADKTEVDANTKIQGDTKAGAGASADIKTDKVDKKKAKKEKRDTSGAGATQAPMTKDEPKVSTDTKTEPAPAPAPADTMKKAD
jgi:hypothetical protein